MDGFDRLFSLSTWVAHRDSEFTIADVAEALGKHYSGSSAAVDRKWTRDKAFLARLGMTVVRTSGDGYSFIPEPRPCRKPIPQLIELSTWVRGLPASGCMELETGLRKLLAGGAPLLDALVERNRHSRPVLVRGDLGHRLAVAHLLCWVLQNAGPGGLSMEEAAAASGASSSSELLEAMESLDSTHLPFDAPYDAVPIIREANRVELYMRGEVVRPLGLLPSEVAALRCAGYVGTPSVEFAMAA
jgi:hypothetical protein